MRRGPVKLIRSDEETEADGAAFSATLRSSPAKRFLATQVKIDGRHALLDGSPLQVVLVTAGTSALALAWDPAKRAPDARATKAIRAALAADCPGDYLPSGFDDEAAGLAIRATKRSDRANQQRPHAPPGATRADQPVINRGQTELVPNRYLGETPGARQGRQVSPRCCHRPNGHASGAASAALDHRIFARTVTPHTLRHCMSYLQAAVTLAASALLMSNTTFT